MFLLPLDFGLWAWLLEASHYAYPKYNVRVATIIVEDYLVH
jgi:hypothetical protein